MSNSIQVYAFDTSAVRALTIGEAPWFVAADVAAVLGYRDASNMVRNLDEDEKGTHNASTLGGDQALSIISESGLYNAIFRSRRPEAQRFRQWVTGDVLPSIRRTGSYGGRDADGMIAAVELVREARATFGKAHAKRIWEQLGLPSPYARLDEADAWVDPLVELVGPWLSVTPEPVSIDDVIEGLALKQAGASVRRRLGRVLRILGHSSVVVRKGQRVVLMFRASQPLLTQEG